MLRLIEVTPSFVINMAFALTEMRLRVYCLVSLAGLMPGVLIFANAGSRLAELDSLSGFVSPAILLSLTALALVPILSQIGYKYFKAKTGFPV